MIVKNMEFMNDLIVKENWLSRELFYSDNNIDNATTGSTFDRVEDDNISIARQSFSQIL